MTGDPTIIAASIVTVIAAIGGVVVQVINAYAAARDRASATVERHALSMQTSAVQQTGVDTGKKADLLIQATDKIHELTNSTNSQLQKSLEVATEKIAGLEKLLAQMVQDKRDVAAAGLVPTKVEVVNTPLEITPIGGTKP